MENMKCVDLGISCNLGGGSHGLVVVLMGKIDIFVQICGFTVEMIGILGKLSKLFMVFFGDVEVGGIDNAHSFLNEKK